MKVLMVLTSHDQLGNTGRKTGFWLEELAAPYYVFKEAGAEVLMASPKGGLAPMDPHSAEPDFQSDATKRFTADKAAQALLSSTVRLNTVKHDDFDAVFYPGGHGPMWDLAEDMDSAKLIESFVAAGKPVGFVCHGPAALRHAKGADGKPLVAGKNVAGFSNSEEIEFGLDKVVPFLLEDELKRLGAKYSKGPNWSAYVESDGLLITGQNPASGGPGATRLLKTLTESAQA